MRQHEQLGRLERFQGFGQHEREKTGYCSCVVEARKVSSFHLSLLSILISQAGRGGGYGGRDGGDYSRRSRGGKLTASLSPYDYGLLC